MKSNAIFERFRNIIESDAIFQPEDNVFVAVSGGGDSMALLHLLLQLRLDIPFTLHVCHFNHQLRPEAVVEESGVREFAENYKCKFLASAADVAAFATGHNLSIHAAARELRYNFFAEAIKANSSSDKKSILVTGHHADDQVETVLMRILSGAGSAGLGGIRKLQPFTRVDGALLYRPLLQFRHQDLIEYCDDNSIQYFHDASNDDESYPRSKIRHSTLPVMEINHGAAVIDGILRSAELMQATADFLDKEVENSLKECLIDRSNNEFVLDYTRFSSYHNVIHCSLIQHCAREISGNRSRFALERITTATEFILNDGKGEIELGDGLKVRRWRELLYVYRSLDPDWKLTLEIGKTVNLGDNRNISARLCRQQEINLPPTDGILYCDLQSTGGGPFIIRPAKAGDRIVPFGSPGEQKISEILRARNIPPQHRDYPVILAGDLIIAVPPFCIAASCALNNNTAQAIEFHLT